jgi:hypothetical protein
MAEAIAAAVVSWAGLTGPAAVVANAVVQVGIYAAANAVTAQNSEKKEQGGLIDLQLNSAAPRQLVIGKRMTGGVLIDWYLAGTNNTKLFLPVYLSEGPCGQVTRVFADGREVWSTPLSHGVRTTIPDFRSGGDRLWLTYYDGRVGQTADAVLVALGQGWTSANKMTGCAYVVIECQWDSDNMRSPPSLSFEMEGAKLYDRRKDTTAGGSGSHRANNPATWEFSDNPAVALDHYMLGRYWSGARTFGIGLSADEVPYSYFAAQANVCDEDVDLKAGGTQKRYRANGYILASDDYSTVIAKLCTAMAARPADFGGRFGVIGVESRTPVLTIDDGDLIVGVQEVYTPKRSWAELVGEVEGRFQDPAQLYQPTPYPNVTDAAWEAEDGGEPKLITLDFEFETNVERAQRLALLKARQERRQATLRGVYPLWTVELERGDWFVRTGTKWGGGGKTFEVIERVLDPATYTVTIVSQEVDAADSAWDENVASDGPPAPIASTDELSAVTAPSLTVTSNPIVGAASNTPAIKIAFTNPTDPRVHTLFVEVYRASDDLKVATLPVTIPDADGSVIIQNGIADGVLYEVRAKYLTPGLSSAWSTVQTVTTGATYSTGTAANVPWSGVTNDGARPANNATVGATSGTNLYRTDGTTVLTQAEVRTAEGVASSITSQGAFATLSSAAYGSALLTGFGALAPLGSVAFGSAYVTGFGGLAALAFTTIGSNIRRADGTTVATESLIVTSLGTASAIASQGALATLSSLAYGGIYLSGFGTLAALSSAASLTAGSITGQGDLATTNRAALPFGVNALTNTEFSLSTSYPPLGYTAAGAGNLTGVTATSSILTSGHRRAIKSVMTGTIASGTYFDLFYMPYADPAASRRYSLPVVPGDLVGASALVAKTSGVSHIYINIQWLNEAGIYVSETAGSQITASANGDTGDPADYALSSITATAPALARFAQIFVRCLPNIGAVNATGWAMSPMLCRLPAGQTAMPPYTPGGVDRNADITSGNTAAAIASQGALATLNSLAYGGAYLSGFGTLAALSNALSLTAGAITNQGWGATASEANAANSQVAFGENLLVNTDWQESTDGWYQAWDGNHGLTVSRGLDNSGWSGNPVRTAYLVVNGTPANGTVADGLVTRTYNSLADLKRWAPRVTPGERIYASFYMGMHRCNSMIIVEYFGADGQALGGGGTAYSTAAIGTKLFNDGNPANAERVGGFFTVPANACYVVIIPRMICVGGEANPYLFHGWPMIAKVSATQTVAPAYRTGQVDRYVDYTPENTAGAISGQGGLATLSFVTISTNLRLADGTTIATTAMVVTASGTAAGITGQGWGATANEANANNGRNGAFTSDFTFGVRDWFNSFGGDPSTVADATGTIVTEIGEGKVYQITNATDYLQPKMAIKTQPNRRFLVLARVRQKTNPSAGSAAVYLTINPMDSSFAHTGGGVSISAAPGFATSISPLTSAGGWQNIAAIYTCPSSIPSDTVYFRPRLDLVANTSGVIQCSRFLITDITDGIAGRALTDLLRADLSTAVTESLIVTLLGTASAITGQGALATKNQAAAGDINVTSLSAISANLGSITSGAIDLTAGSYVARHGAGFGVSSDLVMWYGLASIARGSATKTNGVFTLATDGKVYFGATDLAVLSTPMTATITGSVSTNHNASVTPTVNTTVSVTAVTNGTSPYTYQWALIGLDPGSVAPELTGITASAVDVYRGATLATNADYGVYLSCTITDANGKQCTKYWSYVDVSTAN